MTVNIIATAAVTSSRCGLSAIVAARIARSLPSILRLYRVLTPQDIRFQTVPDEKLVSSNSKRMRRPHWMLLDLAEDLWRKTSHVIWYGPMMNRFEGPGSREARIRYLDGDFQVTGPGSFVRCAVSGEQIPLDELKYWSVARQQPYASATISFRRELELNPQWRSRD